MTYIEINSAANYVVNNYVLNLVKSMSIVRTHNQYSSMFEEVFNTANSLYLSIIDNENDEIISSFLKIKMKSFNPSQYLFNGVVNVLDISNNLKEMKQLLEYLDILYSDFNTKNVIIDKYDIRKTSYERR